MQFVSDKESTPKFHTNSVWQRIIFRLQNFHENTRHASFYELKIVSTHFFFKIRCACHKPVNFSMTRCTRPIIIFRFSSKKMTDLRMKKNLFAHKNLKCIKQLALLKNLNEFWSNLPHFVPDPRTETLYGDHGTGYIVQFFKKSV